MRRESLPKSQWRMFCELLGFTTALWLSIDLSAAWAGTTTIGLYRPSNNVFYLRNSNTYGFAEAMISLTFAAPAPVPIAGDWFGSGVTTTGLFDPSINFFELATSNTSAYGVIFVSPRGAAGDLPVVGDWDGNGVTTTGLFRPSTNRAVGVARQKAEGRDCGPLASDRRVAPWRRCYAFLIFSSILKMPFCEPTKRRL